MKIFNIQHFSTGDGYGIRSTVFFAGCNLHCGWCHNPEGLYTSGKEMTLDEVISDVMSDIEFYQQSHGGVTLSGGEPLVSFDDCIACAKAFKEKGLNVIVDTALAIPDIKLDELVKYVDCFFVDIKTAEREKFASFCGGKLDAVFANLDRLVSLGADFVLRVPLIPGFNTDEKSVAGIIEVIKKYGKSYTLLPFHRLGSAKYKNLGIDYAYADVEPSPKEEIEKIKERFVQAGLAVADV